MSESETRPGTKRKLSQRTLLDSNFFFLSKKSNKIHQSELTNKYNDDCCGHAHTHTHIMNHEYDTTPSPSHNNVDVTTMENVSGVTLQTFIVGRRFFSHENELNVGANISLLPDPHNVKDPNAIKVSLLLFNLFISGSKFISLIKKGILFVWIQVLSADSGSSKCKVLGFLPRELAQYLSPLMEKYCLSFEVIHTYIYIS